MIFMITVIKIFFFSLFLINDAESMVLLRKTKKHLCFQNKSDMNLAIPSIGQISLWILENKEHFSQSLSQAAVTPSAAV